MKKMILVITLALTITAFAAPTVQANGWETISNRIEAQKSKSPEVTATTCCDTKSDTNKDTSPKVKTSVSRVWWKD